MLKNSSVAQVRVSLACLLFLVLCTPAPSTAAGVYFVKDGDTLAGISRLFGVTVEKVREVNLLRTDDISTGDRIRIPDRPAKPAQVAETPRHRDASSERVTRALCRDETVYHSVVRGDTLTSIANRYATDLESLLQLNGLRKTARLSIGQKIVVRKDGPRSHTVRRGETLSRIASRYRVSVDEISRLNQLENNKIMPGQRLLIQPCDPYAAAGSTPPPLGGSAAAAAGSAARAVSGEADNALSPSSAALAQRVIDLAQTMLNVPYRFGGSTLRGIDCSAYVQRVFGLLDVQIPRTAREQYAVGARIGREEIQVGDLVFFRTYASFPSHVGIYLGENLFIHASSMVRKVAIDSIDMPYYRARFIGARRLIVDSAPAVASTP